MGSGAVNERVSSVRPELLELAAEPESVSTFRLWNALTDEDRAAAVESALTREEASESGLRADVVDTLASTFNFRPQTLASWSPERVATRYGANLQTRKSLLLQGLLRELHVAHRRDLLAGFLDELGVPHEGGLSTGEAPPDAYAEEAIVDAAEALLGSHDPEECVVYFLTLVAMDDPAADGLISWLPLAVPKSVRAGETDTRADVEEPGAETTGQPVNIEQTDRFTTIDQIYVRAIADVSQGIEGSLSEDQLEDAVEELVALNSTRHRSYFHLGFMDGEFGRDPREELPAQNPDRTRWYWAGYLTGLARKEQHGEIAALFDEEPVIRQLGAGGGGPSHAAGRLVFEALCRCDRPGEAAKFLDVETVFENPHLFRSLHREGTRLLRDARAADARAIYVLLGRVMDRLAERGLDLSDRTFLEVRRRRAHCFRQLGETSRAAGILEELLEEERDPGIRAMVDTDLGLIDGGFTRLADVRIPVDTERISNLQERLGRGEDRFRRSLEAEDRYAAHGHYCLGVLSLLREEYREAVSHLDLALSAFQADPDRYRHGGLIDNTRVYLGMSIALSLGEGRVERAARLIREGVQGESQVPVRYLEDVLEGLEIRAPKRARAVAEAVIRGGSDDALDVVADSSAGLRSGTVAEELRERGRDPDRAQTVRATDLRRALSALLEQHRHEEAAELLDELESLARKGIGLEKFLDLLGDPESYQPAWSREDALWSRVACLESAGRYEEAAAALEERFHRYLSGDGFGAFEEAGGILERMRSYALPGGGPVEGLSARLEALREDHEVAADDGEEEKRFVRVLFVGGDERQQEHAERVEEELANTHPGISVTFLHPGWGSNWSHDLEEARREVESHDALVIMRFIPTEFGRQLRKSLDSTPWCACTTAGIRTMKTSILQAAELGRRHLARQEEELVEGGDPQ